MVLPGSEGEGPLEESLSELEQAAKRGGWVWRTLTGLPAEAAVQAFEEAPVRIRPVTTTGMRDRQEEVVPQEPVGAAALEEPQGDPGPAPIGESLPELFRVGRPAEVHQDDRVPRELPLVEKKWGQVPSRLHRLSGIPWKNKYRMSS